MESKSKYLAVAAVAVFAMSSASAQEVTISQAIDVVSILNMVKASMAPAINKLTANAISWLGVFATLQFFITNYKLLTSDGDLQTVIAKFFGAVIWVGVCLLIIQNGPAFIQAVGDSFFDILGLELPSPGAIISYTLGASAKLAALSVGASAIPGIGGIIGQFLLYACFGVASVGMYFAFKIFMLQLELGLIAMLSPLSFSLLGLNTLRDQGIAPFKALLSLAYRIILLSVILAAFGEVSTVLKQTIDNTTALSFGDGIAKTVGAVLAAGCAYLLLCYLVFKSDSIAATLSSGNTSMGTGDVASAAAAGAAMGAAVATGGAAVAGAASAGPQSMGEFLRNLAGDAGSVSNASAMGNMGSPMKDFGGPAPSFSTGGQGGGGASSAASLRSQGSQLQAGSKAPAAGGPASSSMEPTKPQPAQPGDVPIAGPYGGSAGPDMNDPAAIAAYDQQTGQAKGSGQTASISGAGGNDMAELGKAIGNLAEQVARGQAPRKPGLRDRLGEANRHMEKEQDRVQVSINPHHHD